VRVFVNATDVLLLLFPHLSVICYFLTIISLLDSTYKCHKPDLAYVCQRVPALCSRMHVIVHNP
jgi:hypothetical protein